MVDRVVKNSNKAVIEFINDISKYTIKCTSIPTVYFTREVDKAVAPETSQTVLHWRSEGPAREADTSWEQPGMRNALGRWALFSISQMI